MDHAETLEDMEWISNVSQAAEELSMIAALTQAGKISCGDSRERTTEILNALTEK